MTETSFVVHLNAALADGRDATPHDIAQGLLSADIARQLQPLSVTEILPLLDQLPLDQRADVFGYFPAYRQVEVASALPRGQLVSLVSAMPADERADLYNRFDQRQKDALLPALAHLQREDLRRLSSYAEGTAGSLMTSEYSALDAGLSAMQALETLRREAADAETIYQTYVLDDARRLLGTVSLRELVLASPETPVQELMTLKVVSVNASEPSERVTRLISEYDLLALPVVNDDHVLVGIVTCDDAMDVVVEEATEDFHKGAMISTPIGNLKDATLGLLYRKRVLWLVLLVFGNLFSGAGIAAFEDVISEHIALVFFLPLLVDSGGNAGSQSATLMVRALATGEVILKDWLRLLTRECGVALALGVTMAIAVAGLGILRGGPEIAAIVASSMVFIVLLGSLIGMSLPFLLSRFRMDPAVASGPLITSIADAAGVLVYFGIATQVLEL